MVDNLSIYGIVALVGMIFIVGSFLGIKLLYLLKDIRGFKKVDLCRWIKIKEQNMYEVGCSKQNLWYKYEICPFCYKKVRVDNGRE